MTQNGPGVHGNVHTFVDDSPAYTFPNGTHHFLDPAEESPQSPEARQLYARLAADEMWEAMSNAERLYALQNNYAPAQWFEMFALQELALVWDIAKKRGAFKAAFKG